MSVNVADCESNIDFEERLLSEVQLKPWLFDKRNPSFKDTIKKNNSWIAIGEILEVDADKCRKEWECLRKQYTTHLRKIDNPTGSAAVNPSPFFRHSRTMEFYRDHYRPYKNKTVSNFKEKINASSGCGDADEDNTDVENEVFQLEDIETILEINSTKRMDTSAVSFDASTPRAKTKRKSNEEFEQKFLSLYEKKSNSKEDEFYRYGMLIAHKLRKLSETGKEVFDVQTKILEDIKEFSQLD